MAIVEGTFHHGFGEEVSKYYFRGLSGSEKSEERESMGIRQGINGEEVGQSGKSEELEDLAHFESEKGLISIPHSNEGLDALEDTDPKC